MLTLLIIFVLVCVVINYSLRAKGYRGPVSDHFDGRKFHNFCPDFWNREIDKKSAKEVLQFDFGFDFFFKSFFHRWRKRALSDGLIFIPERVLGKEIVVTFINHSTVLIQTESLNILTDPVWSNRASSFPFIGPKRYMPAGVEISNLPKIDLILQSHNHYDHLDIKAREVLLEAVKNFDGTVMLVSHDRHFLRQVATRVFEVDHGEMRIYEGSYTEYLHHKGH